MGSAPINPTCDRFVDFVREAHGDVYPLVFRFPNDSLTANAVFRKIERSQRHAFFLESVETGEKIGRYSFMGLDPRHILSFTEGTLTVKDADGKVQREEEGKDPLRLLQAYMQSYSCGQYEGLPPFWAGAVGYLSYDCVHFFEPTVGEMKPDEIGLPEMMWVLPGLVVVFDHMMSQMFVIRPSYAADMKDPAEFYTQSKSLIETFIGKHLTQTELSIDLDEIIRHEEMPTAITEPTGRFTREEYDRIIGKAKNHIYEGDIFQAVPSQRYSVDLDFDPYDVYRHLRHLNPSPYMFYLKLGEAVICGSSPEVMLRCTGDHLTLKPIAGSRPRGKDGQEDERLAKELLSDEKELAEHRMLVDLARNDLGRVAEAGSVRVSSADLMAVERYSHVMHIVSTVHAKLAEGLSAYDAVRATFPAGTLSGAPKVRAMQIINEIEPTRRNVYGGLCGYFGFDGNADSCIALRMMVAKDGKAYIQAGGGLVADSDPELEYQEIINKASAVLRAIKLARDDSHADKRRDGGAGRGKR